MISTTTTRKRVRVPREATVPMLVTRGLQDEATALKEHMLVEAFAGGWATVEHYDELANMVDLTAIAATEIKDRSLRTFCNMALHIMHCIRARFAETRRMGVTGEELKGLREFVEAYRDFWLRQPESLNLKARATLELARKTNVTVVEVKAA